ncbi:MAG: carbohydrate kinase, partial [Bacilli bacterium]|nr:carbohydrate kinase [Bacilli bacterium]
MFDVVSLGEMIIDFLPNETGRSIRHVSGFKTAPGGAPANVAVAIARLGGQAAFIGKVGQDEFGALLADQLQTEGVNTAGLRFTTEANTGLAFVQISDTGERSFLFYRNPSADMLLDVQDLKLDLLQSTVIFHYGSLTQIGERSKEATLAAIHSARAGQAILSYDVNIRPALWPSIDAAREQIQSTIPYCDILKVSEEEVELLTGQTDIEAGSLQLLHQGPQLVLVTLGERGTYYRTPELSGYVKPYQVRVVDTTGAGDAFMAGFLRQLADRVRGRSLAASIGCEEEIKEMLRYANAAGALTVTRMGA